MKGGKAIFILTIILAVAMTTTINTQMQPSKIPIDSQDGGSSSRVFSDTVSLPVFQVLCKNEKITENLSSDLKSDKGRKKVKLFEKMEMSSNAQGHRSGRKGKAHSKHDHKCHKAKHKSTESLLGKQKNYFTKRKGNWSTLSMDSGLSQTEILSPFEINITAAYEHLRTENTNLRRDIEKLIEENEQVKVGAREAKEENENLRDDVSLMKNLVYKLNVELEKYQNGERQYGGGEKTKEKLPKNYEKDFLKPVLPLLKAYSESLIEKEEIIKDLESEYKKFNQAFNDLLEENEKLYVELEKKLTGSGGDVLSEVKLLKKDLEMAKQENNLLFQQIKLEKEKLVKVHSVFKIKVEEVSKEKEDINNNMEECKTELYMLRGKYGILKQEFERMKMNNETRVPLEVHSASVNECRKLFQDLKNEYENEKHRLLMKIKEQGEMLAKKSLQEAEEKNFLEKSNLDQSFEIENLRRKVRELEEGRKRFEDEREEKKVIELRKELRESNIKIEELSTKLSVTKKQLQKAMAFAEDIVRGQEGLLLQLHEKQKENKYMTTQFGSLKSQLKDVERGAQEGLNSVEEKIRSLEAENYTLAVHNRKLEKLLIEKEEMLRKLEPTKDS